VRYLFSYGSSILTFLQNAKSIAGTVMNLLSALALVNNGVREILPFIRYVSQFLDFEFNAIKSQDKGNGVVCAATWSLIYLLASLRLCLIPLTG